MGGEVQGKELVSNVRTGFILIPLVYVNVNQKTLMTVSCVHSGIWKVLHLLNTARARIKAWLQD